MVEVYQVRVSVFEVTLTIEEVNQLKRLDKERVRCDCAILSDIIECHLENRDPYQEMED